ncbi:MAG: glycosyltransferase [Candidatus Micrarchaeaceae archaeon]
MCNKIEFYTVSNEIGGEYIHFSRIAKYFETNIKFFWDKYKQEYVLKPNSLLEKVILIISLSLFKIFKDKEFSKYFISFINYFVPTFHNLNNSDNIKIVSTGFMPVPKGKNIVAYVVTPPRIFTVDFEMYKNKIRNSSKLLYFIFLFAKKLHHTLYLKSFKRDNIKILSDSKNVKDRLVKFYGINSTVLYPSIDVLKFKNVSYQKYFLYLSRFEEYKRQDFAIKAFEMFYEKNKTFKLILAGPYPKDFINLNYLRKIQDYVKERYLPVEFKFNLSESEKIDIYSNSYSCLFCTKDEDFGLVPLEAMASSKPIISVNEGGPKETIIDGITGFLVNNEKEMAERMEYLAQNPDIVKKMGNAGREHVLKNFDDNVFVENLKKILEERQTMSRPEQAALAKKILRKTLKP